MNHTKRPTMPALEHILGDEFKVLDRKSDVIDDFIRDVREATTDGKKHNWTNL